MPLNETRRSFKKAYTLSKAASLIGTTTGKLNEIFDKRAFKYPEQSYDLSTYKPLTKYINEEDMLELRQVCYDLIPKNKYGIPYKDTLASEEELIHAMMKGDERDFITVEGDLVRIFRA